MKAARVLAYHQPYSIEKVEIPTPNEDQLLVKTGAAGFCHTDLMIKDGDFHSPLPITGSHEPCGTVVEVGSEVKGFKKGDRIGTLPFMHPCGECPDCKSGTYIYCDQMKGAMGIDTDGAFGEYFVCDPQSSVHLPDSLSFEHAAPLFCAGATIYNAIKRTNLKKGDILGIVGLGALGHLGIQFAKCMGLTVVGIDSRKEPISLSRSLKYTADLLIDSSHGVQPALGEINKLPKSSPFSGLDAVIIATGANEAFEFGADLLRKHGTLIVVGQPPEKIAFSFFQFIFRDITFKGSLLSDAATCQEMVNMVAEKGIEVKTKSFKLEQINDMVEEYHKPEMKGKFVVTFS